MGGAAASAGFRGCLMGAAGWVVVQDMALYHDPEHAGKKREMEPLEREGVAIRTA